MNYLINLIQIVPILAIVYFYFQRKFNYWSNRGVKGPIPSIPFGNFFAYMSNGPKKMEIQWNQTYGPVYGMYNSTTPVLTICDTELIKQVLIKDFPSFVNRNVNLFDHEMFLNNLFSSEDEKWKRIRAITSPTFSTGKLRRMNGLMDRCVDMLSNYLTKLIETTDGCINAKEVITGFTIDVIASSSFATETNCNVDGEKSIFRQNGIKMNSGSAWRFLAFFSLPKKVNKWIGNEIAVDMNIFNFFIDLSREVIRQRKEGEVKKSHKQTDLVQLLIDAFVYEDDLKDGNYDKLTATADNDEHQAHQSKNSAGSQKRSLTENEIIAQCVLFFTAGFETTSTTISNSIKQLIQNPDIQERLYSELTNALDGVEEGSDDYHQKVNEIAYLEAFIKETLRCDPPVLRMIRRVGVDGYTLAGIPLEKNTEVNIGAYSVHMNPKYYPDPEKFDPERFMPEKKHLLVPYSYLPFGQGPRNCIGMRFAYQEIRLCLAKIVRQFKFQPQPPKKGWFGRQVHPSPVPDSIILTNVPVKVSKRVA